MLGGQGAELVVFPHEPTIVATAVKVATTRSVRHPTQIMVTHHHGRNRRPHNGAVPDELTIRKIRAKAITRMDHVDVVVNDLEPAISFVVELSMRRKDGSGRSTILERVFLCCRSG